LSTQAMLSWCAVLLLSVDAVDAVGGYRHGGGACVVDALVEFRADLSCNLNGRCTESGCECKSGWTGSHCGTLDLAPAQLESGCRSQNESSWGGTIVPDRETAGKFHLVAAKMISNCGLTKWKTNSVIVHTVSSSPIGPFLSPRSDGADEVVHTAFSHGPVIWAVAPDQYAMYQIGCGQGGTVSSTCINGSTPGVYPQPRVPDELAQASQAGCDNPHWTGVAGLASSPSGPFGTPKPLELSQRPDVNLSAVWHNGGSFTNPSLTHGPNGTVLLAYAAGLNRAPGHKHIGIAEGASWDGPFFDLTPHDPIFDLPTFENSEDPHLFKDDEGNFHLFSHTGAHGHWLHVAAHAFSRDGRTWTTSDVPPYTRTIEWEGGFESEVFTRERPQLYVDDTGVPVALANGVQPGNASMPFTHGYTGDWSYTHVQAVRRTTAAPVII